MRMYNREKQAFIYIALQTILIIPVLYQVQGWYFLLHFEFLYVVLILFLLIPISEFVFYNKNTFTTIAVNWWVQSATLLS